MSAVSAIAELERLSSLATGGMWRYDGRDIFTTLHQGGGHFLVIPCEGVKREDCELIVACVNALRGY